MSYTVLQNQTVGAAGTWPQTLTLTPDLTFGGVNVQFQNGTIIGVLRS